MKRFVNLKCSVVAMLSLVAVLFASQAQAGHISVSCGSSFVRSAVVLDNGCLVQNQFVALRGHQRVAALAVPVVQQRLLVVEQRVVRNNRRVSILDRLNRGNQRSRSLSIQRTFVR